jgi:hypothetical protein
MTEPHAAMGVQSVSIFHNAVPMNRFVRALAVIGMLLVALPVTASAAGDNPPQSEQQPAETTPQTPSPNAEPGAPVTTGDGTPATVIDDREVEGILGKNVRSSAGEDMGQIIDVIVNRDGQVRAAVIDFGGFLGVGSRKIAVDWHALSFPADGVIDHVILNLTRDQVRLAPEYRSGEPLVVLGAATAVQPKPDTPAQSENLTPEK